MPYKIVKSIKHNGYQVKNIESGKKYSKHPISKKKAEAQLRILRQVTNQ